MEGALLGNGVVVPAVPAQRRADEADDPVPDAIGSPLLQIEGSLTARAHVGAFHAQHDRGAERSPEVAQQTEDEARLPEHVVVVILVLETRALRIGESLDVLAVVAPPVVARPNVSLVTHQQDHAEAGVREMRHLEAKVGIRALLSRMQRVQRQFVPVGQALVVGPLHAGSIIPSSTATIIEYRQSRQAIGNAPQRELPALGQPADRPHGLLGGGFGCPGQRLRRFFHEGPGRLDQHLLSLDQGRRDALRIGLLRGIPGSALRLLAPSVHLGLLCPPGSPTHQAPETACGEREPPSVPPLEYGRRQIHHLSIRVPEPLPSSRPH